MKAALALVALTACFFPEPNEPINPINPDIAEASTYKVLTPGFSQCTGWVADELGHVITAGHCCDVPGEYRLISSTSRGITASLVAWEDDDEDKVDICLLRANSRVAPPLPLADAMPNIGDSVGYVGYPKGVLTRSTGKYLGDIDGPEQHWADYTSDAPCNHGASGSAMYHEGGVYGVLVRLIVVGDDERGCAASPLSQIVDILQHR